MFNHTLGWTSDDGPNVFALGWLSRVTLTVDKTIIADGGMDGNLLKIKRLKRRSQRNVKNLVNLVTLFVVIEEGENE